MVTFKFKKSDSFLLHVFVHVTFHISDSFLVYVYIVYVIVYATSHGTHFQYVEYIYCI
jgi:hypothetical protein